MPTCRTSASLAAVLVIAIFAALAPRLAQAHGEHDHSTLKKEQERRSVPVSPARERSVVRDSWPCPDTPAHRCACGNLIACSGGNDPVAAGAPVRAFSLPAGYGGAAFLFAGAPPSVIPFANARARAPPLLS